MNLHFARLMRLIIIYLDNCCYSRLFDVNAQAKVKMEAAKIRSIIDNRILGGYAIVGSAILSAEMGNIRDIVKRTDTKKIYDNIIIGEVDLTAQSVARAQELEFNGLGAMDARHLALAEEAQAGYLLTTDIDFIKKCARPNFTVVKVINPLDF